MKRSAALMAVAGLLIAGCSQADTVDGRATTSLEPSSTTEGSRGPTGELNPDTPITAEGLGPIKAGMTLAEVRDVAGELTLFGYEETGRYCWHATINRLEAPFELTFLAPGDAPAERPEDGELARVSAYGDAPSPPRTDKGVGIGSTKAEVLGAYESDAVEVTPHFYTDGEYIDIPGPQDPAPLLLRFETDGAGRVTAIRGGLTDAARAVEGCA